ncbi:Karyopherin transporter [Quaeritorhiza haematococci]|nr:Karyopherin transporter [Quaeritorhiza haematococci]
MEAILDFNTDLDVALLDRVVSTFYSGGPEAKAADTILNQFQQHPDAWKRVDVILERSQSLQTKYIALQILENLVKTMWKALPQTQRQGIKTYIVGVIIKTSSDDASLEKEKTYLGKLNIVLVQILKHEWPHNWPTFIPEIVASSKTNLSLCENNMQILKLLSEEIFDFSAEQMTQQKTANLKNQMCGEFSEIFQLCHEILEKASKPSLVKVTLETLLRFLNWIPLGYIFETNLIDILRNRFLEVPQFRNVTLKCLTEIGGLQVGPEYNNKFVVLFNMVMQSVNNMIPVGTDLANIYENSTDDDQQFVQNLALFLTNFLGVHLKIVEQHGNREFLLNAHVYLIRISQVREREIFKICLEYWAKLVAELYDEIQSLPNVEIPLLNLGVSGSGGAGSGAIPPLRKHIYAEILSNLRVVMIERMVKPEEVLIVENDEGEIVREFVKESDTITLYKSMREVLVYLTHLDVEDTENIMSEKLAKQMDLTEFTWENLNTLCWAIGSISGAMSEETEKKFLVTVIKDLLGLCEMIRGKDNKAVVASNIMYVVGQYPRFLKAHWKFLKTVVNKLFEFMHETHEGVQDMACDTFIKIAQKCKRHFVMQQPGELMPYIEEILGTINSITADLTPQQVHTFYEAVGHMISAQPNKQIQERLITKFMELPNSAWDNIMQQASQSVDVLNNPENIKILGNVLKTNVSACTSIGHPFIVQLGRIYMDMLGLYKAVSELISANVAQNGEIATKWQTVRALRTIKKEILKLVDIYVSKAEDLPNVSGTLMPPLLEAILGDYQRNVEPARDAEVLSVTATIVTRLGDLMTPKVPAILDAVFECTLNMINKNFVAYPEHRTGFYKLLQAINQSCFPALLKLPGPQFKLFLDSIVWAFKHPQRDISDTGLSICLELLTNFAKTDPSIANAFFQTYFLSLLQDIFYVLTNSLHKSGFKLQSMILMQMFALAADSRVITAPLFSASQVPNPNMTNAEFLKEYVGDLLQRAFPHLQTVQIRQFVVGLFELNKDYLAFKAHLRDFLIQLKEFAGDDLLLDEREAEAAKKKQADLEAALKIPGMVKPHDRPDDGMMD